MSTLIKKEISFIIGEPALSEGKVFFPVVKTVYFDAGFHGGCGRVIYDYAETRAAAASLVDELNAKQKALESEENKG